MKYFIVQEFIPPEIYSLTGDVSIKLMDKRILSVAERLRNRYGPLTVNNWHAHGQRKWSGLRVAGCPYGTEKSQHRFGRAIDCIFKNVTAEEVRTDIIKNQAENADIRGMELGVSWLHVDCRDGNKLITFRA